MAQDRIKRIVAATILALVFLPVTARAMAPDAPASFAGDRQRSGVGGVSLFKAAELLDPWDLTGARAEWVNDHLELIRNDGARTACPPLNKEYVALAIRCVYGQEENIPGKLVADEEKLVVISTGPQRYGEVVWNKAMLPRPWQPAPLGSLVQLPAGPGVGILYTAQPSKVRVTYYGPIAHTRMGKVLMEADRALYPLMYGIDDSTGKPVARPNIPGFMTLYERRVRNWKPSPPPGGKSVGPGKPENPKWWHSGTWFVLVPGRFTLRLEDQGRKLRFAETRMQLDTWTGGDELDQNQAELAQHVCEHYAEYAEIYPAWRDLVEVAKAVSLVRLLKQQGAAVDEAWARACPIERVETVETMTTVNVQIEYGKDGKPLIEKQVQP